MAGVDSKRLRNEGSISPHSMGSVSSSIAEPPVNVEEATLFVELFLSNIWKRGSMMGSFLQSVVT